MTIVTGSTTGSFGGVLVPVDVQNQILDLLVSPARRSRTA